MPNPSVDRNVPEWPFGDREPGQELPVQPGRNGVKVALTANAPGGRRSVPVENSDYSAFVGRILRAYGRRLVDEADLDTLADMVATRDHLDQIIHKSVTELRATAGFSWADIAAMVGTSRQAAQQRYGRGGGGE